MKPIQAIRLLATSLVILLPLAPYAAEAAVGKASTESATLSNDDIDAISERIRQTGAKMRADVKEARARLDAQKAEQEAARKVEAKREAARQAQAQREAAQQAETRKRQSTQEAQRALDAQKQAALKRQDVMAKLRVQEEKQAAKERAAQALQNARQSSDVRAFAEGAP